MVRRVLGVSPVAPCARRHPGWWQPHVEWVADDYPWLVNELITAAAASKPSYQKWSDGESTVMRCYSVGGRTACAWRMCSACARLEGRERPGDTHGLVMTVTSAPQSPPLGGFLLGVTGATCLCVVEGSDVILANRRTQRTRADSYMSAWSCILHSSLSALQQRPHSTPQTYR